MMRILMSNNNKLPVVKNVGLQEMQKVMLQLYSNGLVTKQDIIDFTGVLKELVDLLPDKQVYKM